MNAGELAACLNKRGRKELPVSIVLMYKDEDGALKSYWGEVESVGLGDEDLTINGELYVPEKVNSTMTVADLIVQLAPLDPTLKVELVTVFGEEDKPLVHYQAPKVSGLSIVKEDS